MEGRKCNFAILPLQCDQMREIAEITADGGDIQRALGKVVHRKQREVHPASAPKP